MRTLILLRCSPVTVRAFTFAVVIALFLHHTRWNALLRLRCTFAFAYALVCILRVYALLVRFPFYRDTHRVYVLVCIAVCRFTFTYAHNVYRTRSHTLLPFLIVPGYTLRFAPAFRFAFTHTHYAFGPLVPTRTTHFTFTVTTFVYVCSVLLPVTHPDRVLPAPFDFTLRLPFGFTVTSPITRCTRFPYRLLPGYGCSLHTARGYTTPVVRVLVRTLVNVHVRLVTLRFCAHLLPSCTVDFTFMRLPLLFRVVTVTFTFVVVYTAVTARLLIYRVYVYVDFTHSAFQLYALPHVPILLHVLRSDYSFR